MTIQDKQTAQRSGDGSSGTSLVFKSPTPLQQFDSGPGGMSARGISSSGCKPNSTVGLDQLHLTNNEGCERQPGKEEHRAESLSSWTRKGQLPTPVGTAS